MMRVLLVVFLFIVNNAIFAGDALPSDSVYHVGGAWQTESNETIQLEFLVGKPQVIALIYTGCTNSCPVIVESMKRIEKKTPAKMRSQIGFVLISLTPDTDYPKVLKAFAEKKKLNQNWKLLRGNNELVRTLSNALNGRYKVINDGDVAHSNTVTLLNEKGQIELQSNGSLNGIKPIVEYIGKNYSH
ncbi:MAG: SCO family protein [Methylophilaceae bacterium]